MHGQHQGEACAQGGYRQPPAANAPAWQQAVGRNRARICIAIGVVHLVDQDQRQRNQPALRQQQRLHQVGRGQRQRHQHAQAVTPHIGQRVTQPGAAQRSAAVLAVAGVVGHQRQPRNGHGDDQIQRGQHAHAASALAVPQRAQALGLRQRHKLPAQPQQRQHHQGQGHAGDQLAHQLHHRPADEQHHHAAPQQCGQHGPLGPLQAARLLPNRYGGIAHHHQLKRAPAHQLHDVQHDGQAGKAPAIHRVHQPRAGQAAVAAQLGDPAQQPGAQQRARHNRPQGLLGAQRRHQVGADLHYQQAHAQAEPQRGVVVPLEDAAIGRHGHQGLVDCRWLDCRWGRVVG